jgi:signal transduction histidine kinase
VSAPLADELLAVLREALSNVSRHAHAHHVDVDIAIRGGQLILTVTDDGVGLTGHSDHAGQGQRNMEARAADVGGTFDLSSVPTGGARVSWSAPMTGAPPDP